MRTAKKLVETDRIVQVELELSSEFRPIPLSILVESDVPAIPESRGLAHTTHALKNMCESYVAK